MKRKEAAVLIALLLLGTAFIAWDIYVDMEEGSGWAHVVGELTTMGLLLAASAMILWKFFQVRQLNLKMQVEIGRAREDLDTYRKETAHLAKDLNQKVHAQMLKWNLSAAEQDICWMVLKGLANKEISHLRNTSEKTVTQQLSHIYSKSGLQGRSELLAFFLEDLFVEPQK